MSFLFFMSFWILEIKCILYKISNKADKLSITGINFNWPSINWTYKSHHVGSNSRFCTLSVLIVNNNPWNISMGWFEGLGFLSHFYNIFNTFSRSGTAVNIVPVQVISLRAFLSTCNPIVSVTFKTDNKGKCLSVKIIFFDSTCLDKISLAFSFSMLTSEVPAGSILSSFSISIRIKIEVTDFPEILNWLKKLL